MTERLSTLLHDEATALDVPPPTAAAVLSRGRRLQRRRRTVTWGASLAALAVIGGAAVTASSLGGADTATDDAPAVAQPGTGPAFSIGTTVYLDGGRTLATVDDKSIKSLYYTSAGLLVRHGNNPYSDGGGPQRFSLVTPEGAVRPIGVVTEETVAATDPEQPYLAYAETTGGTTEVVLRDLRDDTEAARIALPSGLSWGGWPAPPVALSGDLVYVGTDDTMRAVNWRTGEITEVDTVDPGYPDISAGRSVSGGEQEVTVVDVATGDTLLDVPLDDFGFGTLSPDGHFVKVDSGMDPGAGVDVYDVETGASVTIEGEGFGWSPDSDLFSVHGSRLTTCEPTTGECTSTSLDLTVEPESSQDPEDFTDDLKLGGLTYES
jgi:hypothetical protein